MPHTSLIDRSDCPTASQIKVLEQVLSGDNALQTAVNGRDDDQVPQIHVSCELDAVLERVCGEHGHRTLDQVRSAVHQVVVVVLADSLDLARHLKILAPEVATELLPWHHELGWSRRVLFGVLLITELSECLLSLNIKRLRPPVGLSGAAIAH